MPQSPNDAAITSVLPGSGRNESLFRAFELLAAIGGAEDGASVAELAQSTGLPRSTVTRILASLFDISAVARPGDGRRWVIGPAILQLAHSASPLTRMQEQAAIVLRGITEELGETSMLAIPTGKSSAWVIEEARSTKLLGIIDSWVGRTVTSTASGFVRLLLADLPERDADSLIARLVAAESGAAQAVQQAVSTIREEGYSMVIDELEEGLAGLGYPVRSGGKISAMIAIYMPSSRFTEAFRERTLEVLAREAHALEMFLQQDRLA